MNKSRITALLQLIHTRNLEFFRDTSTLAWSFMFPVLVIFGFYFAFTGDSQEFFKVARVGPDTPGVFGEFYKAPGIKVVDYDSEETAIQKLKHHQVDLVLTPATSHYWFSSTSPKGQLAEKILIASTKPDAQAVRLKNGTTLTRETLEGREIRYVDWLISGLLAMNMMFNALFGVGYVIVRYRKNGVLKRLKATPLRVIDFLMSQIVSRLFIILSTTSIVYLGCNLLVHFRMEGSYLDLLVVLALGASCLISLGLVVAAASTSEEFASGLLNLLSWPMMFLSGVWFSLEGLNPVIQKIAMAFPLTHVIEASRKIMTEGAGLGQLRFELGILAGLTILFLTYGSLRFRWEK